MVPDLVSEIQARFDLSKKEDQELLAKLKLSLSSPQESKAVPQPRLFPVSDDSEKSSKSDNDDSSSRNGEMEEEEDPQDHFEERVSKITVSLRNVGIIISSQLIAAELYLQIGAILSI